MLVWPKFKKSHKLFPTEKIMFKNGRQKDSIPDFLLFARRRPVEGFLWCHRGKSRCGPELWSGPVAARPSEAALQHISHPYVSLEVSKLVWSLSHFSHTDSHTTRSKASQTHINGTTQVTSATSNHQFQFFCQHRLSHFKSTRDNFLKLTFCFNPKGKEVVSTHFSRAQSA